MNRFTLYLFFLFHICIGIELTLILPALPELANSLSFPHLAPIALSGNFIATAFAAFLLGPLSDRVGRKPLMVLSHGFFLLGTLGCAFASTATLLIMGRVIQGVGAGIFHSVNYNYIADVSTETTFSRRLSQLRLVALMCASIAPFLTAFFLPVYGESFPFLLLASLSSLCFLFSFTLPESKQNQEAPSSFFSTVKRPMLSLTFWRYLAIQVLLIGGFSLWNGIAPLLMVGKLGFSPKQFGISEAVLISMMFFGNLLAIRMSKKQGANKILQTGVLFSLGAGAIATLSMGTNPSFALLLGMSLLHLGNPIIYTGSMTKLLYVMPDSRGACTSIATTMRYLTSSAIVFLFAPFTSSSPMKFSLALTALGTVSVLLYYSSSLTSFFARDKTFFSFRAIHKISRKAKTNKGTSTQ